MREPRDDPQNEPVYRAILAVLVASVLVGGLLTLAGEPLFGSRALTSAGFGMALVCGALYWVFRLIGRRAQRQHEAQRRHEREPEDERG